MLWLVGGRERGWTWWEAEVCPPGEEMEKFPSIAAALSHRPRTRPELLIVGTRVFNEDGIEALPRLRSRLKPGGLTIVVAHLYREAERARALEEGAWSYADNGDAILLRALAQVGLSKARAWKASPSPAGSSVSKP